MSFFSSISQNNVMPLNCDEGNPAVPQALSLWNAQDWRGLKSLYRSLPAADRTHMIIRMGWALAFHEISNPYDYEPEIKVIIAGITHIWAWKARGFGYGHEIEKQDWEKCDYLAEQAYLILKEAEKDLSKDSALYAIMLYNEHLLAGFRYDKRAKDEGGKPSGYIDDVVNHAVDQLETCTEQNILAAHAHILFDSPKWHGDLNRMYNTTHYHISKRPSAYWLGLHAMAYFEEWYWYVAFEEDAQKAKEYKNMLDTLPFIGEIHKLNDAYWNERSQQSTNAPFAEKIFAYNYFSILLTQLCQEKLAKPHLEEMGKTVTFIPWCRVYAEDEIYKNINKFRAKTGLKKIEFKD